MAKSKKIKLFIGLIYISAVILFLYFIFTKFSFQEITSYEFIKNNRDYFYDLRQTNLFLLGVSFILFSILWVFAAGFGSPLALFAGFIFGKWFGLLFTVIGLSIGATLLYVFANYFLKEMIRDRFLNRFQKLEKKFQKSEFLYLLVYRFVGGIPFQIQNVLPCIFNVKVYNYFWSTFLGMIPSIFIMISIGSGLEEIIDQNLNAPSVIDLITSPSIYIPLIAFFGLLIITIFFRKVFYKN
ncbi:VTT domain-containing protein [Candidatus Pelagibacter bacterium]|nr:VTT domain-containing protein [Candidatus Pelagibacter bacterium]